MNELSKLLQENLNIEFISATLSNPKNKDGVQKVKVRPILKKDVLYFQLESFRNNQAFHENVEEKKACEILLKYMENMRQMQMETQRAAYTILVSKKGKVSMGCFQSLLKLVMNSLHRRQCVTGSRHLMCC